jgi:ABC-type dipeptide/oligopeptide/nickel transport system ATPase subunit
MIDVSHLSVSFRHGADVFQALRDVSFAVAAGASLGIVGESGSGKSTVLRALAGLNRDWTGTIRVDGSTQTARRDRAFHKKLQMVFQDPYGSLHPRHTVHRILSEPLVIHGFGDRQARVGQAMDSVGLPRSFLYRYPHQLSGGQRQRVSIARALGLEPQVLLLDEPTSALDVSVQAEILNLLAGLRDKLGLTFILVSHNLAVVAHLCDRIAVMRKGELIEELGVAELRNGSAAQPYTRELLQASKGYVPASHAAFRSEDPQSPSREAPAPWQPQVATRIA